MQEPWWTIKSVPHSSRNKSIVKFIQINTIEATGEFDIAQLLNDFFTGMATELEADLPTSNTDPLNLVSSVDFLDFYINYR